MGDDEGDALGEVEGAEVGDDEGAALGELEGAALGAEDGKEEGLALGAADGAVLGDEVGQDGGEEDAESHSEQPLHAFCQPHFVDHGCSAELVPSQHMEKSQRSLLSG